MKKEQERSNAALEAKLAARRNRKAAAGKAQLEKNELLEEEEENRRKMMEKMQKEAEEKQSQEKRGDQKVLRLLIYVCFKGLIHFLVLAMSPNSGLALKLLIVTFSLSILRKNCLSKFLEMQNRTT